MVRLLGVNKKRGKKRLSPSARTPEERRQKHPMYQYAINEFSQTVAAGTSNDAGKLSDGTSSWSAFDEGTDPPPPGTIPENRPSTIESSSTEDSIRAQLNSPPGAQIRLSNTSTSKSTHASDASSRSALHRVAVNPLRSPFEAEMPDAAYEEYYGDAYTGGNIKYVYPSGYQSMRPRSCPWKLSIVVCVLFTWLSIFIVGHCSDEADQNQYRNDEIDDDSLVIDMRWCGSRPLYLTWVASMLITGLAAAYCSVIGYIKVRDFAVGNSRSQPPGVVNAKSDYYVRIEDGVIKQTPSTDGSVTYKPSIYQSDGTPQFWGAHIYRPTQAAVAITSR